MSAPHNILMLAFLNGQLLDITGPLQMFAGANDELKHQAYRIEVAAPERGPFATSSGVQLLGRLRLRGPRGAQDEFVLAAIAQNLRRLASLLARPPPTQALCIA